jgi:hypothetical protein
VNVDRQLLERNLLGPGQRPKLKATLVHGEPIVVDVPRPQSDTSRLNRQSEVILVPHWRCSFVQDQSRALPEDCRD